MAKTPAAEAEPGEIYRTVIFGGSADIDPDNMLALLNHWMPENVGYWPPVLQATIPRSYKGLKKVEGWLKEQFKEDGATERPADLIQHISSMETDSETYLVVLWGEGDDKETEALVDAATLRGIPVLDLTDGLEQLKLDDNEPASPGPAPERAARRERRGSSAVRAVPDAEPEAAAVTAEEQPPWDQEQHTREIPPDLRAERTLAYALAKGLRAMADVLAEFANVPEISGAPQPAQPEQPAREQTAESTAPTRRRGSPKTAPSSRPESGPAEPTRTWLRNPVDKTEYVLRGRGRPRRPMADWDKVELTAAQEKELGLTG